MSKSVRIVLVDPLGDILFSGESIAQGFPAADEDSERCPETKRSATSDSGIYPAVAYTGPRQDQDAVETDPERPDEIRSSRPRAA